MKQVRKRGYIVAIDGPAGAGKSTVSRLLAISINGELLDTGGMYRSVALAGLRAKAINEIDYANIAKQMKFGLSRLTYKLTVNGRPLGASVRTERVSAKASEIGRFKSVRTILTREQRRIAEQLSKKKPVIIEGRDIGTVVIPHAPFKFFVTANVRERALRRYRQLKQRQIKRTTLAQILLQIRKRDKQDSKRKLAPLRCPEDAVVVDTSKMEIRQVVNFMRNHILGKLDA